MEEDIYYGGFKEGDIVRFCDGWHRGAIGTVKGVSWHVPHDGTLYVVVAEGDADDDCHEAWDNDIEKTEPGYDETDDEELLGMPSFQPGDVVAVAGNEDMLYAVSEVITVNIGETPKYMYDAVPLSLDGTACAYEASSLEYQYHDASWGEYFSDIAQRGLPAWRDEDGYKWDDDYVRGTLPSYYMDYIWEEYSIGGRICAAFASRRNMREVMEKFNLRKKYTLSNVNWDEPRWMINRKLSDSRNELYDIIRAIRQKIENREEKESKSTECVKEAYLHCNMKFQDKGPFKFTALELAVAAEADRRDIAFGRHRDHFPIEMTRAQMRQAIREAYSNAHKAGKRKIQRTYDRRYDWGEEIEPVKGASLYEGEAGTYGLVIRFWYNFDMDLIEIAYPVMGNGDSGKRIKS